MFYSNSLVNFQLTLKQVFFCKYSMMYYREPLPTPIHKN